MSSTILPTTFGAREVCSRSASVFPEEVVLIFCESAPERLLTEAPEDSESCLTTLDLRVGRDC